MIRTFEVKSVLGLRLKNGKREWLIVNAHDGEEEWCSEDVLDSADRFAYPNNEHVFITFLKKYNEAKDYSTSFELRTG